MPKLNYQLKKYKKAVLEIALSKGLVNVRVTPTKGSTVRFELFEKNMSVPMSIWIIHHSHDRKQEIWSREDYRKAARNLCCSEEEFLNKIKSF